MQWIDVNKELPEPRERVLTQDHTGYIRIGVWSPGHVTEGLRKDPRNYRPWGVEHGSNEITKITHWMPLPKSNYLPSIVDEINQAGVYEAARPHPTEI